MKKIFLILLILFVSFVTFGQDVYVGGYFKSNGTYVKPHYRTRPDNSFQNNYSSYGNTNPYTGEKGYKRENSSGPSYGSSGPSYGSSGPSYGSSGRSKKSNCRIFLGKIYCY